MRYVVEAVPREEMPCGLPFVLVKRENGDMAFIFDRDAGPIEIPIDALRMWIEEVDKSLDMRVAV